MKFDFVIGNPPYQESKEKTENQTIYVLDKETFVSAIDSTVKSFIPEDEYNNYANETQKEIDTILEEFSNAIQDLPQFPQNIEKLNKLLDSDDSKISDIANQISNDVALTGELLKTVNSAAFALQTPCSSISDAVKMIGTRGIKNMLYSIGSLNIFAAQTKKNEDLWKHSYQVAFYSYNLAKNFCKSDNSVVEDSFVCGLLHDMGKVIFETNCPEYIDNVKKICRMKNVKKIMLKKDHEKQMQLPGFEPGL